MANHLQLPQRTSESDGPIKAFLRQMTLADFLFILAIATKPLYLRKSGSLQVSDILFVLVFALQVFRRPAITQTRRENSWLSVFMICLLYQFCVNAFWSLRLQEQLLDNSTALLKNNLFYVFNFIVCITILQLRSIRGFSYTLKLYLVGTAASVAIALIGVLANPGSGIRTSGSFNNPNQLGYFCIISLTVVTFFAKEIKPSIRLILVAAAVTLSIFSMSKASIVASAILLFAYFLNSRDRVGPAKLFSVLAAIIAVAALIYILMYANWKFLLRESVIINLRKRLGALTTENDSGLGLGRGYDRIREIGFWNLVGVGEGAYSRFEVMTNKEVHSLFASFIVSYGFVGLFLLGWLTFIPLFKNKRYFRSLLCFAGILAYCVTHNGVRNTLFWALLAMLMIRPDLSEEPGGIQRQSG